MSPAPDHRQHGERLRELLHRYRAQEQVLRELLEQQQDQLEETDRQHCRNLLEPIGPEAPTREEALQTACEELANELLHVRMAVIGTAEELALHEQSRPALPLVAAS